MLIDIRCKHCRRLLGRVSSNFYGIVELHCRDCKRTQRFSLADLTHQSKSRDIDQSAVKPYRIAPVLALVV